MRAKRILGTALLAFVAFSVGVIVAKSLRRNEQAIKTTSDEPRLVVFYFHATRRCPTCQKIEKQGYEAIAAAFGSMLADGRLRWQTRNFEERENHRFVTRFEIVAPSLVIAKMRGDKIVAWRDLDKVWDLVHEPDAYREYVQKQVRAFIEANMPEGGSDDRSGDPASEAAD